ncbi:hypothetical protein N7488_010396 [Penicillium malachiteum]|nr:hypothetical protein N7488_010396 [Penicillium malachiteum]
MKDSAGHTPRFSSVERTIEESTLMLTSSRFLMNLHHFAVTELSTFDDEMSENDDSQGVITEYINP